MTKAPEEVATRKYQPAPAKAPRKRETLLGPVEWKAVDPLALSMADRQSDSDNRYQRRELTPAETGAMKMRWQARQLKRVSNAAAMYGPRESIKHLFDDDETEGSLSPLSDVRCASAGMPHFAKDPASSYDAYNASASATQGGARHITRPPGSATGSSLASQGSTMATKRSSTVTKQISSVFKRMMGKQESGGAPQLAGNVLKSLHQGPSGGRIGHTTI